MSNSKILILVSGSIAAYKACYLVSKLAQAGHEVKVVASKSALQFVGATTFEALSHNEVAHDLFESGHSLEHISLMRWADIIVAAPATAHLLNRMAMGIGDDLLTTLYLAHDFTKPFLVAPAMNTNMYLHPATQNALKLLRAQGVGILETASGVLACGEEGWGKLLDPDLIAAEIDAALGQPKSVPTPMVAPAKRPRVLITSGGCVEAIDQVRAITNTSSGATGARLADHFYQLGCNVTFVTAQKGIRPKGEVTTRAFTGFHSLQDILFSELEQTHYDAVIHAAAVSDYSVALVDAGNAGQGATKISSDLDEIKITLRKNPKLIAQIKSRSLNPSVFLVGFKLSGETEAAAIAAEVRKQIDAAHCDLVVQNNMADISPDKSSHTYHIYDRNAVAISDCTGIDMLGQALSTALIAHFEAQVATA